jgi:hypothetical protein
MLSAVNTYNLSLGRTLANLWKDAAPAETLSSGHTFYLGEVEVGRLYSYMSGRTQIEVHGKHFLLKQQKRLILFTQNYTLEGDGRTLASAKETKLFFHSNCQISYAVEGHSRELTLKPNFWSLRGRQWLLWDGPDRVGVIKHDSDFGADIDLPPEIPLAVQVFIYGLAFIIRQRGKR